MSFELDFSILDNCDESLDFYSDFFFDKFLSS